MNNNCRYTYSLRTFLLSVFILAWGAEFEAPARVGAVPAVTSNEHTLPGVSDAGEDLQDEGADVDSVRVRQPFWANTFYKAGGGVNLHYSTVREYRRGHDFTLAFGKRVGDFSTVRLSGTVETYFIWNKYKQSSRRAWLGEANLLYGLEVDNFWNNGKDSPVFELSPFAGVGFDLGRSKGKWTPNGNVQFGIELGLKLSQNLYFTLEPTGKYYFHELEDMDVESSEYSASVTAGLRYKVHNLNKKSGVNLDRHLMMEEHPFMNLFFLDNTFYRVGAGVNIQKSTFANGYKPGPTYEISAGKKLSKLSSVMLKLVRDQGYNKHKDYDVDIFEADALYGFDLTSALYGYKYDRLFNVSALAGGGIDFININDKWRSNANLQAGADFNVRIGDSFSIYLDPMAKIYLLDNKELIPDRTFSLELSAVMGVQYTISRKEYRNPDGSFILDSEDAMRALALSVKKLDKPTSSITDNSYVTFLGGSAIRSATRRTLTPGFHTGIEFGKNLNRYHSVALDLEYDNFRCEGTSSTIEKIGVDILHSMNLTNLSSAKKGFHLFDLKTVSGLGLNQFYNRSLYTGLAGVVSLGLEADINATEKVTFVIRPLARGYFGHVTDETFENTYGLSGLLAAGVRINMTNRSVPDYKKNKRSTAPTGETKYGFNALQLALQSRHRPTGAEHSRQFIFDNKFISVGYNMENVAYNAGVYDLSSGITLRYGNRIWKNNSLMAELTTGTVRNRISRNSSSYNELEFEHSFHLTSYIHGFNPNRTFEVSSIEGIGVNAVNDISEWRFCGNAKLGLDFNLKLSWAVSLFLDTYFKVYTDNIDGDWTEKGDGYQFGYNTTHGSNVKPIAESWRNFDFGYGATAGLRMSLTSKTTYKLKEKRLKHH